MKYMSDEKERKEIMEEEEWKNSLDAKAIFAAEQTSVGKTGIEGGLSSGSQEIVTQSFSNSVSKALGTAVGIFFEFFSQMPSVGLPDIPESRQFTLSGKSGFYGSFTFSELQSLDSGQTISKWGVTTGIIDYGNGKKEIITVTPVDSAPKKGTDNNPKPTPKPQKPPAKSPNRNR